MKADATVLDEDRRGAWERDGFVALPGFVAPDQIESLRRRINDLVDGYASQGLPAGATTVFSTTEQTHAQDEWFLTSADVIRPFFEDGAFDAEGNLIVPIDRALNKMGHALHDLDPVFDRFSRTADLASLVAELGVADPLLLQSMVIFKPPRIGGEVVCHCDHSFLWTDPQTVIGLWFALDDATVANGCMWAIPGGHVGGARTRFRLDGSGGTTTDILDPTPYNHGDLVPMEAEAGTLIAFHGCLPHWSGANTSHRPRLAYTLHVIDGMAHYRADNWLQRGADLPLRGFA
ncbi:MAG: phytanoyl-CoA dioxygenase family protein [Actinomycetota bacterium]|nr:phytanoyl-CoA dioxygenase family protein [Acidimicrobiales bacterium]MEC9426321.1 phytanoyl-CoA dioxygenase family protein [Actinomycetota bacterium]MED5166989.1 phytanoyl-CoA dioxygenase family protein [Actinomycetota bacterium]MED5233024.1 phytanoyl-CoA dioxygenase family protein [Actinomycetota bacterium]MED5438025.1 phytanoyl-CoA dioxygenase family protein [Actinomycetota bacterium]